MARNTISLSTYAIIQREEVPCDLDGRIVEDGKPTRKRHDGPFKVIWREWVEDDGARTRQKRSRNVSDVSAMRDVYGKVQAALERGEVPPEPQARVIPTIANLELVAVAWLNFQAAHGAALGTLKGHRYDLIRIFRTIRKLRSIPADASVPASSLSVPLVTEMQCAWRASDAGGKGRSRGGGLVETHIYGLCTVVKQVWRWAAAQPTEYPGVPPVPADELIRPRPPIALGAPEAPTWGEVDAVIRRAYEGSQAYGDLLLCMRMTGLRHTQAASIRRSAIDVAHATLRVIEGSKSAVEKAEMRRVPVPRQLLDAWVGRLSATAPGDYIFPALRGGRLGHMEVQDSTIRRWWAAAVAAGEVRAGIVDPPNRRINRPCHAFRAAYIAGLEAATVEVHGRVVRVVEDKTIAFLVGHHPSSTKDRHYSPTAWSTLEMAVALVPPYDPTGGTEAGNVVAGPWGR
jgi:integrase